MNRSTVRRRLATIGLAAATTLTLSLIGPSVALAAEPTPSPASEPTPIPANDPVPIPAVVIGAGAYLAQPQTVSWFYVRD